MPESVSPESAVQRWVEDVVVGLNLCPFAKREVSRNGIRYAVSNASDPEALLEDLRAELSRLLAATDIETTLLIHPCVLLDFLDFNDFLSQTETLLDEMDLTGVMQIASFHPLYRFHGTGSEDAENYTNRAPYPVLHLLREDSLTRAIDEYPDTSLIPEHNIKRMNELGTAHMQSLLNQCIARDSDRAGSTNPGQDGTDQTTQQ